MSFQTKKNITKYALEASLYLVFPEIRLFSQLLTININSISSTGQGQDKYGPGNIVCQTLDNREQWL